MQDLGRTKSPRFLLKIPLLSLTSFVSKSYVYINYRGCWVDEFSITIWSRSPWISVAIAVVLNQHQCRIRGGQNRLDFRSKSLCRLSPHLFPNRICTSITGAVEWGHSALISEIGPHEFLWWLKLYWINTNAGSGEDEIASILLKIPLLSLTSFVSKSYMHNPAL